MKKLLPILLVFSLLIAGCLVLSSCSGMTESKASKDPFGAIGTAMDTSLTSFFSDDEDIAKIDEKAAEMGSYNLILATDMFPDEKLYELDETLYIDKKGNAVVSETKLTLAGEVYRATIWGDKKGVALKSESLFGSKDTLKLTFDRFIAEFKDSDLCAALELDEETAAEVVATVEKLVKSLDEKNPVIPAKDAKELEKKLYEIFAQEITSETLTIDGKEVDCIRITYTLNNEKFAELVDLYMTMAKDHELLSEKDYAEVDEMLSSLVDDLNESVRLDLTCSFCINAKSKALAQLDIAASVDPVLPEDVEITDDESVAGVEANLSLTISESKITLAGDVNTMGEKFDLTMEIAKKVKDKKATYTFTAGMRKGNIRMDLLDATYEYDKSTGKITFNGFIATGETDSINFELEGLCEIKEDSYTYSLKSFKILEDEEELFAFKSDRNNELSLTVSALKEIPAVDEDAKDIMDMDEAAWTEFMQNLSESDLAKALGGILGDAAQPEVDYDSAW